MATKGNQAKLEKQIRDLQEAQRIKDSQINDLQRKVGSQPTRKVVWAEAFENEFDENTKAKFIRDNKATLKALLLFSDKRKRKLKKQQFNTVMTQAKEKFQSWMSWESGDDWKLKDLTLTESWDGGRGPKVRNPEEDTLALTFSHPGLIYAKVGDPKGNVTQGVTPTPELIKMTLRMQRYDIDIA